MTQGFQQLSRCAWKILINVLHVNQNQNDSETSEHIKKQCPLAIKMDLKRIRLGPGLEKTAVREPLPVSSFDKKRQRAASTWRVGARTPPEKLGSDPQDSLASRAYCTDEPELRHGPEQHMAGQVTLRIRKTNPL
jgi:hypothetical protein